MSLPLEQPLIYLITKGEGTASNFSEKRREIIDIIRVAVEEKVSHIQLREKHLPVRLLFDLTLEAASVTKKSETLLLVNDRADIALAARADGVHLAANSLSADVIRRNFPGDFIIGVSTHSLEAARSASRNGADFVVFGPIFETPGKDKVLGTVKLTEVCKELQPFPVLALGGIDASNVRSVLETGASGFAAIRSLNNLDALKSIGHLVNKRKIIY